MRHGLDQVQWALGMDDSGPVEVWTEGGKFNPPTITQARRRARGATRFAAAEGLLPLRQRRGGEAGQGRRFGGIFFGEKGTFTIDRGSFTSDPPDWPRDQKEAARRQTRHIENWIDCIKSRKARSPTSRSAIARPRSATWATSPAGPAENCNGTP